MACYCWSDTGSSGYLRDKNCNGKPSASYSNLHKRVFDGREHPSQVKKVRVHAVIPIDKDPWTWTKLRNIHEVAQDGPDHSKRRRYLSRGIMDEQKQRVWDVYQVAPKGGRMSSGSCSTLDPASSVGGAASTSRTRAQVARQLSDELEVLPPPPPFVNSSALVRKPKSARTV